MTELYDKVKAMAVRFEFKPGERLNELDLARRLQVSRTPLREVLNQLMVEGFLKRAVNRGFIARPLDAQQVHALYEYRVVLETGIARIACERASDEELDALYAYAERSLQLPEDADAERRLQLDEAFHLSLARVSGNEEFVRSLAGVYDRIHFVRWVELQRGPRSHAQSEHLQIVQGLQRRDTDAVVKLLTCHIGRRLDQIVDVIRSGVSTIYMREDASSSADVAL